MDEEKPNQREKPVFRDMLFDDDMELADEAIRDVMIPDCEEYEEESPEDLDPYDEGACDEDYEPPEYFSD